MRAIQAILLSGLLSIAALPLLAKEEPNPFDDINKQIGALMAKDEKASDKDKPRIEKEIKVLEAKKKKQLDSMQAPIFKKMDSLSKKIDKAKDAASKEKLQKEKDKLQDQLDKLNNNYAKEPEPPPAKGSDKKNDKQPKKKTDADEDQDVKKDDGAGSEETTSPGADANPFAPAEGASTDSEAAAGN